MATAYVIELPNFTPEQGQAVLREMGLTAPAAGQVLHIEGPMEGGLRIVDVWESQAAFDAFISGTLAPAFQRLGLTFPSDLQPRLVWPVTGLLK